ncbi:hypothetical protein [Candidatus Electronema sp. PJ]|uniref:hypothetical protein n=1 Tax=Candidatus Electronema sp. PJ TaxID=3401572 RepID=UPI003AA91EA2
MPWVAVALIMTAILLLLAGLAVSMRSRLVELDRELMALRQERAAKPAQLTKPVLPPDSKIHIDAQVRILDDRQVAAKSAALKPLPTTQDTLAAAPQPVDQQVPSSSAKEEKKIDLLNEVTQQPTLGANKAETKQTLASEEKQLVEEKVAAVSPAASERMGQAEEPLSAENKAEQSSAKQAVENKELSPAAPAFPQEAKTTAPQPSEETKPPITEKQLATLPPPVDIHPRWRKQRVSNQKTTPSSAGTEASQRTPSLPQTAAPVLLPERTFSYLVKDGETALDIAEKYYGHRKYYPVVMEQNPHIFLGFIRKNSIVRLFTDRREAIALYQQRIEQQDGLLLWKYHVRSGETWRSIYARFFLPRYSGLIFYGKQEIAPGKTIRVILR